MAAIGTTPREIIGAANTTTGAMSAGALQVTRAALANPAKPAVRELTADPSREAVSQLTCFDMAPSADRRFTKTFVAAPKFRSRAERFLGMTIARM